MTARDLITLENSGVASDIADFETFTYSERRRLEARIVGFLAGCVLAGVLVACLKLTGVL